MSNRKQRRRKKAVEKRGDLPANSNQMSGFNAPPVGQQDKLFLNEMLKAAVVEYVDGDRDKSAGMFRHILKIEPHQAECLFRLGVIRGRKKDFLESMLLLKRAYEIAPDQYKLLRNYAIALQKMDRLQEALDIQRQAVLHEKMDRKVLVLDIANSHATLHQFFDAMEFYDEAVKLNPDNALAHYNRALNLQNLGSNQNARLAYERALEIDPD
ncbi:MAG: tetratricopeptide repeat protein, partial [Alphaproteobacteria bacterium]